MFVNGTEVDSDVTGFETVEFHSNQAGLGARNSSDAFWNSPTGDYFTGWIDDVRVYDLPLSGNNVAKLADMGMTGQGASGASPVLEMVQIPDKFALHQNYPNPFNPETTIQYDLPRAERVCLKIYDLLGREVATLLDKEMEAGYHKVLWNSRDANNNQVSTGLYIVRVVAGDFISARKILFMK